jgi:hypothetical protein
MKRRTFITLLGSAAAWPGTVIAQTPSRLWKIGVLANEPWPPLEGLRHGLRDLGYDEGKSHRFEYRFAQGRAERFPALASELVNLPVDLIVAWGTPASLAARCSRSRGANPGAQGRHQQRDRCGFRKPCARAARRPLRFQQSIFHAPTYSNGPTRGAPRDPGDLFRTSLRRSNIAEGWHQLGAYVGRVLKGAKPADLPVVQASKLELVINHQTARMSASMCRRRSSPAPTR